MPDSKSTTAEKEHQHYIAVQVLSHQSQQVGSQVKKFKNSLLEAFAQKL